MNFGGTATGGASKVPGYPNDRGVIFRIEGDYIVVIGAGFCYRVSRQCTSLSPLHPDPATG